MAKPLKIDGLNPTIESVETEAGTNPAWETGTAFICVLLLLAFVAVAQLWPSPASAAASDARNQAALLAERWSKAPMLRKLAASQSFKVANSEHRSLMVRGWLDKSVPTAFHSLKAKTKESALKMTVSRLSKPAPTKVSSKPKRH